MRVNMMKKEKLVTFLIKKIINLIQMVSEL